MLLVGAAHLAYSIAEIASRTGFRVSVADTKLAGKDRFQRLRRSW